MTIIKRGLVFDLNKFSIFIREPERTVYVKVYVRMGAFAYSHRKGWESREVGHQSFRDHCRKFVDDEMKIHKTVENPP